MSTWQDIITNANARIEMHKSRIQDKDALGTESIQKLGEAIRDKQEAILERLKEVRDEQNCRSQAN